LEYSVLSVSSLLELGLFLFLLLLTVLSELEVELIPVLCKVSKVLRLVKLDFVIVVLFHVSLVFVFKSAELVCNLMSSFGSVLESLFGFIEL